jgi:hypothetical protein
LAMSSSSSGDPPGERALQQVSKLYGSALIGIKFDGRWNAGWDLADDMPPQLFKEGRQYIGPLLAEMRVPATWATNIKLIAVPGKKAPDRHVSITQHFKNEWVHSVAPEAFVNAGWPQQVYYRQDEFNNRVQPFSDVKNTAELLRKDDAGKVETLTYSPALRSGVVAGPPRAFNTHQPSTMWTTKGNPKPWLKYLKHLIPEKTDRIELMRWIATLIARPGIKMSYGVLLISETQGVGKSTLGEKVLLPLLGKWNVSEPEEAEIVDGSFNSWVGHKRLAVVHEIYQGHGFKAYNKLKSVITERRVRVNRKNVPQYEIDNWCHILACSNSPAPLKLAGEDRRWFVPKATELKRPQKYWEDFNLWLEAGGLSIIAWWATEFLKKYEPVQLGAPAPSTMAKAAMIEEGYSSQQRAVADMLDEMKAMIGEGEVKFVVTDKMLVDYAKSKFPHEKWHVSEKEVREIAKVKGWFAGKNREFVAKRELKARVIASKEELAKQTPADLRAAGIKVSMPM